MKRNFILLFILFLQINLITAQTAVEKEIKTGNEYAKMVEAEMGLWQNQAMQEYIDKVGQRLVAVLPPQPYPYTFQIVDQWEPNAFSIPGGHVYVSRGLLVLLKTESELAGVIGHEIGHIISHHSLKQQKQAGYASILAIPAIFIGTVTQNKNLENLLLLPAVGIGKVYLSKYGRGQEYEADRIGLDIATKAGYEANGLPDILSRLEDDVTYLNNGKAHQFSLFDDHPMTPDRVEKLNKMNAKLEACPREDILSGDEFTKIWSGLLYGPNPNEGVFVNSEFLHPDLKFQITFPSEAQWSYVNEKTAVGCYTSDKKNIIALTIASEGSKADSLQQDAVKKLKAGNVTVDSVVTTTINGYHVTQLYYNEVSSSGVKSPTIISWIEKDKVTYVILGQGEKNIRKEYNATLHSFKGASAQDLEKIKITVVRTILSIPNETLTNVNFRSGNKWDEKMFCIVNGVGAVKEIEPNQHIKVLVEEEYK